MTIIVYSDLNTGMKSLVLVTQIIFGHTILNLVNENRLPVTGFPWLHYIEYINTSYHYSNVQPPLMNQNFIIS